MDNKLLNKAITLSAKEEKLQGGKPVIKIKDEKGLTYTVYKQKQDGTTTVAWDQLQSLNIGDTVQISYVEDIKDTPEYGRVTYRTIRNFNLDIGSGIKNAQEYQGSQTQEKPRGEAPTRSQGSSNDQFGRRLALHGFANAMLSNGAMVETVIKDLPALGKLEDAIDRYLNEPEALTKMREKFGRDDLPTIEAEDEAPSFSDDELPAEEVEGIVY